MFSFRPGEFHDLASGRTRGLRAGLLRGVCRLAEVPYGLAVWWRNRRFDRDGSRSVAVDVPVICVGNLTTGGTGKTPMVQWLAGWFRQRGLRVCIVSRGYRAEEGGQNDEALELELRLPDVPHLQNADRVSAARTAIEEFQSQLVILDDGFQHRRLRRDLDIVLLDALEPFGFGHLLPRGLLREPISSLRRASVVVFSRADAVDAARRDEIRDTVQRHAPDAIWVEAVHRPTAFINASGKSRPLTDFGGEQALAFCGIGNPEGFRKTLQSICPQLVAWREFPDHHAYSRNDLEQLARQAKAAGARLLVCTHKDLVKIRVDELEGIPLWALQIEMAIQAGLEPLEIRLGSVLSILG